MEIRILVLIKNSWILFVVIQFKTMFDMIK